MQFIRRPFPVCLQHDGMMTSISLPPADSKAKLTRFDKKETSFFVLCPTFRNSAAYDGELTGTRKKKQMDLFCSSLVFSQLCGKSREITVTRHKKQINLFCSALVFS
ncbi:MAG: hypothetical protein IJV24_04165 [Prevotella sp.]|nr:hypothetical protein [Prevotella sp.]